MDSENSPSSNHDSSRRIARLPSDLVNQIAAGEVVERPSSLIKELVENSLDAGSTRIEVHLKEGGLAEIAILDDGCGICEEDLPLAVERHTTSKLNSFKDLESISTFGFRGEALSSIASVSDFSIRSRPRNSDRGVVLHVPYGQTEEPKPIGCPPGTQVIVKNLFSKVPARFKFLRSQTTELSHCAKIFRELALGNPQTSFFLHHNDRLLAKFTAQNRAERFKEVLKPEWEPLHLTDSIPEMAFEAFLSPFDWTQERGELTFFINQRPVKNRLLLSCLKQSYTEIAGPHHEPSGVFYLDIQGDWVDVNVHPQKLEVRFYRQEKIYSWILTSVKKQLLRLKRDFVSSEPAREFDRQIPLSSENGLFPGGYPSTLPWNVSASSPFRYLGVLQSKYFLLENQEGLFILNPKAYLEREYFLNLQEAFEKQSIPQEPLSVPVVLS
ncbi:MAG: DNA mismatch repair endonuclease MutL, partial [Deltaproteobacteria bacterium]